MLSLGYKDPLQEVSNPENRYRHIINRCSPPRDVISAVNQYAISLKGNIRPDAIALIVKQPDSF